MKFLFETIFFTGDAKDGEWTGKFISPSISEKMDQVGQLFVLISLSAPQDFDSRMAGDLLVENIQDIYYEDLKDKNIISKLEKAILSTAKRLEYLLMREKIAAEEGIDLNIEAVVMFRDYVYMAVLGEGSVFLWRNNSLINLTEGLKDLSGRNLIRSGSGKFKENDGFILLSPDANLKISEQQVEKTLTNFEVDGLEKFKENPLLGLLFIKVSGHESNLPKPGIKEVLQEEEVSELDEEPEIGQPIEEADELDTQVKDEDKKDIKSQIKDKLSDKETYKVIWQKIKESAGKVFLFVKTYIWEGVLGMGKRGVFLKGAGPKTSLRGIIILIILVVCLLYLSIRGIQKHSDTSDKKDTVQEVLTQVDEKFSNGRNLGTAGNIEEAVKILEEAMNQLSSVKEYGVLVEEIEAKETEGLNLLDEVRRVITIDDSNIITDIAGYIDGGSADDITLWQSLIYITDTTNASIYSMGYEGGEPNLVVGSDATLTAPVSIVFDGEGDMMIYDRQGGILKLLLDEKQVDTLAGLSATSVGEVTEMDNYLTPDGANILYLLRASNNDVRKITKYPSGYSLPELRLANEQFNGASDIEIDGKIYIMTQSDGVIRYFGDGLDPYTFVGLDKSINDGSSLELDDYLLYIGDNVNKRVVAVTKGDTLTPNQGHFVAQVHYRGENDYFSNIKDLVVDNGLRLMFILDGTRIFRVDLSKVDEYAEEFK
jgi:hypothetical protein